MKVCSKCKENKQTTEFNKRENRHSGLTSWCKACSKNRRVRRTEKGICLHGCGRPISIRSKSRCEVHLEEHNKQEKERIKDRKNTGLCIEGCGRSIALHSSSRCESCLQRLRISGANLRERNNASLEARQKRWVYSTFKNHKQKGIQFKITQEELFLLVSKVTHCQLCESQLNWFAHKAELRSPTLERINNEQVIRFDNIMLLCHSCNTHKGEFTVEQLLEWCEKARKFYTTKYVLLQLFDHLA